MNRSKSVSDSPYHRDMVSILVLLDESLEDWTTVQISGNVSILVLLDESLEDSPTSATFSVATAL